MEKKRCASRTYILGGCMSSLLYIALGHSWGQPSNQGSDLGSDDMCLPASLDRLRKKRGRPCTVHKFSCSSQCVPT